MCISVFVCLSSSFVHVPAVLRVTYNEKNPLHYFTRPSLFLSLLINSTSPRTYGLWCVRVRTLQGVFQLDNYIFSFSYSLFPTARNPVHARRQIAFLLCATELDSFTAIATEISRESLRRITGGEVLLFSFRILINKMDDSSSSMIKTDPFGKLYTCSETVVFDKFLDLCFEGLPSMKSFFCFPL